MGSTVKGVSDDVVGRAGLLRYGGTQYFIRDGADHLLRSTSAGGSSVIPTVDDGAQFADGGEFYPWTYAKIIEAVFSIHLPHDEPPVGRTR